MLPTNLTTPLHIDSHHLMGLVFAVAGQSSKKCETLHHAKFPAIQYHITETLCIAKYSHVHVYVYA